jgi:23S rRNA (guanine2445-N2)-methyltransferase
MSARFDLFATCPRGLEALLAGELAALGGHEPRAVAGGVAFGGDLAACYRANLGSRFATRVLLRLGTADYRREQDVYEAALALPWPEWFGEQQTIRVDVNATRSPLRSLEFATLRVKDAVCDRFRADRGARPNVDTRAPDVRIHCYLDPKQAMFYLDTSGEPLYKRGYRKDTAEAPLRENLAAGIVALTGWDAAEPLLDPMCGTGTLVIEAALMALAIPPGHARGFGFERLRIHDARLWKQVRDQALAGRRSLKLAIFGRDRYGDELKKAARNAEAAGVSGAIELKQAEVLETGAPGPSGVLVANPPYGVRLGDKSTLTELYPRLGDALKRHYAGWRCYLFSGDPQLAKLIRLHPSRRIPLYNGALECRLYEYRMVAGSMRKDRPR